MTVPAAPDDVQTRFDAAQAKLKANAPSNGAAAGLGFNIYAHDKRVAVCHRIFEGLSARLGALSEALEAAGWSSRQVSQAELLQMVLHFHLPETADDAAAMLQQWALLKGSPPPPRGTTP